MMTAIIVVPSIVPKAADTGKTNFLNLQMFYILEYYENNTQIISKIIGRF